MGKFSVGMTGVAGHHVNLESQRKVIECLVANRWQGSSPKFLEMGYGTGFIVNACCALGYPVMAVELEGAATTVKQTMQPHDLVSLFDLDVRSLQHGHLEDAGVTTITCLIGLYEPTRRALHLFEKASTVTELAYLQPHCPKAIKPIDNIVQDIKKRTGWSLETNDIAVRLAGSGRKRTICVVRRKLSKC